MYYSMYILCSNKFGHSPNILFQINSSLYSPNFANVSGITQTIRQFEFRKKGVVLLCPKLSIFFISNAFNFLFRKKEVFFENSYSWIFFFSQVKVFIACHISKIYVQLETKTWFYLAQNFRFFISFREKEEFRENSCSWIF